MTQKNSEFTRKHFFIDRNLQGRYMLSFLIPMLVLLCFMLFTLYFGSMAIIDTTTRIIKRDIESKIAVEMQDVSNPSVEKYRLVVDDINDYIRTFSSNSSFRKELLGSLLWVFGIGILLVIIEIVLVTVFYSHKLAGPVYRFERVCHNVLNGKYTDEIRLRKGDEMQNLALLINDVLRVTRERFRILQGDDQEKKQEVSSNLQL